MALSLVLQPERSCATCTDKQQAQWGCERDAPIPIVLDGAPLLRCPRRPFLENPDAFNEILVTHRYLQQGLLREPGTWADQSHSMTEALLVVSKAIEDAREIEDDSRRRRASVMQKTQQGRKPAGRR